MQSPVALRSSRQTASWRSAARTTRRSWFCTATAAASPSATRCWSRSVFRKPSTCTCGTRRSSPPPTSHPAGSPRWRPRSTRPASCAPPRCPRQRPTQMPPRHARPPPTHIRPPVQRARPVPHGWTWKPTWPARRRRCSRCPRRGARSCLAATARSARAWATSCLQTAGGATHLPRCCPLRTWWPLSGRPTPRSCTTRPRARWRPGCTRTSRAWPPAAKGASLRCTATAAASSSSPRAACRTRCGTATRRGASHWAPWRRTRSSCGAYRWARACLHGAPFAQTASCQLPGRAWSAALPAHSRLTLPAPASERPLCSAHTASAFPWPAS
jgi:hypothetical protein